MLLAGDRWLFNTAHSTVLIRNSELDLTVRDFFPPKGWPHRVDHYNSAVVILLHNSFNCGLLVSEFLQRNACARKIELGRRGSDFFWWKDILRLNTLYRGIAMCHIGAGDTVLFWNDIWSNETMAEYPRLFSFCKESSNFSCICHVCQQFDFSL
uniref:Reverse transcriptase zinc-binding domain-containing protein n=1 Tax=Arundo donax TaxID=35708 RepID=A0A0A8ZBK2_ARUDO